MQCMQVRFIKFQSYLEISISAAYALFSMQWTKKEKKKKLKFYIPFLGLTNHVYSNFPFVTSVGDRCFEEKHVFIASKAIENAAWKYDKMKFKSMILFPDWIRLLWFPSFFLLIFWKFRYWYFIFPIRYKCHKECVPNAPPNCGFSEIKLRRAIDNTDIQNALGK